MENRKNVNAIATVIALAAGAVVALVYAIALFALSHFMNGPKAFGEGTWRIYSIVFYTTTGCLIALCAGGSFRPRIKSALENAVCRRAEELMPLLYECENNGVTALVKAEQYHAAVTEYKAQRRLADGMATLYVVPDAMLFCADDHLYPISLNHVRTGNYADMQTLTVGCRVKSALIFVPFSSFVMGDKKWQSETFRPPSLGKAQQMIRAEKDALRKAARYRRFEVLAMCAYTVGFGVSVGAFFGIDVTVAKVVFAVTAGVALVALMEVARRRRLRSLLRSL
jgi:hypothetical protein